MKRWVWLSANTRLNQWCITIIISFVVLICLAISNVSSFAQAVSVFWSTVSTDSDTENTQVQKERVTFTGDIMLGREVEDYMQRYGSEYPFVPTRNHLQASRFVVGNFEGVIPPTHRQTPDFGMRFSFRKAVANTLTESGVTHASLANNHSLDYGVAAFKHTQTQLSAAGLSIFGTPGQLTDTSVSYVELAETRVALVGLFTLHAGPNEQGVQQYMQQVNSESDLQIAYVHWGTEYEREHSPQQASYAKQLVDAGFDVIVGHHPHVVQDIQIVDGSVVFYSLGNFVFDQYFSTDVQEGLVLDVSIERSGLAIALHPTSAVGTPAQSRLVTGTQKRAALVSLADRSALSLQSAIKAGEIKLSSMLAHLP